MLPSPLEKKKKKTRQIATIQHGKELKVCNNKEL